MQIVLIEDHVFIRDLFASFCRGLLTGVDLATARTGEEGLALCAALRPDLVFLDIDLPDGDGLDRVDALRAAAPGVRLVVITSHSDEFAMSRVVRARVDGFVDKNEAPLAVLAEAVTEVMAGRPYFSGTAQRIRARMRSDPAAFDKVLSPHEQSLMALFGRGLTNEEIAERLALSSATVKAHRRNVMGKVGVHSTPELIHYALRKGFVRVRRPSLASAG